MHPAARVFQYLLMVVGLVLLPVGFAVQSQPIKHYVNFNWECTVQGSGSDAKQDCSVLSDYDTVEEYDGESVGLTISLAGVGLLVASVSVAVGGSRGPRSTAGAYGAGGPAGHGATGGYGPPSSRPAAPPAPSQPPTGPTGHSGGY